MGMLQEKGRKEWRVKEKELKWIRWKIDKGIRKFSCALKCVDKGNNEGERKLRANIIQPSICSFIWWKEESNRKVRWNLVWGNQPTYVSFILTRNDESEKFSLGNVGSVCVVAVSIHAAVMNAIRLFVFIQSTVFHRHRQQKRSFHWNIWKHF